MLPQSSERQSVKKVLKCMSCTNLSYYRLLRSIYGHTLNDFTADQIMLKAEIMLQKSAWPTMNGNFCFQQKEEANLHFFQEL